MIIGELKRYLRDNNSVRVSRSMRDMAYKALTTKEDLQKRLSREPTIEEIAKEMKLKKSEVVIALDSIVDPVSLQEPVYSDGGDVIYMMDQIKDEQNLDDNWLEEISIKDTIKNLSDREKLILSMRFFEGKTQMEVASEIGISQAQVSRLEKGAIDRIRAL